MLLLALLAGGYKFSLAQTRPDTIPLSPAHYQARVALFRKEAVVANKIVFLGHDPIERANWKRLLKDSTVINRGINGDNTYGLLHRLDEVVRFKPSKVFMLIGGNDLVQGIPNAVVLENIFAAVGKLHSQTPKSTVYIISLLAVNPTVKNFPVSYSRQEPMLELNRQLKKYSEVLRYVYVDVHEQLVDKQGLLDPRYSVDGINLTPAGYQIWVDFLRKSHYL